jgi:broad specificity phosphatase PhoE
MGAGPTEFSSPLRVYMVRHGETAWSLTGQHTGRTDMHLSPRGEDEARALRPRLRDIHFDTVLTSPLRRARLTCNLAGLGAAAAIEPDLTEWDYGDYEGRVSTDIRQFRPGWNCYRDGCPGGESPDDISRRADRIVTRLRRFAGNVAIFTHGEFGCSLAARWIGLAVVHGEHFQLGTASISILSFNPAHPGLAVIAQWNVVSMVGTAPCEGKEAPSELGAVVTSVKPAAIRSALSFSCGSRQAEADIEAADCDAAARSMHGGVDA